MTSLALRGAGRRLLPVGIAILSQAGWLTSAGDGRLVRESIATAPIFEQETHPGSAQLYTWLGGKNEAKLALQGDISFRISGQSGLRISFPGARHGAEPQGEAASYPVSYYLGSPRNWHSGLRWERVRYRDIYPGIDLVLRTNAGKLEFVFEVLPGADPGKIKIRYHGAAVQLNEQGDLLIGMGREQIRQPRAVAFQQDGVAVRCSYSLQQDVTLRLGTYDSRRALTIDPVLNFSTYIGGPGYDAINALAVDGARNIYVTGVTSSSSLSPGSTQTVRATREVWVAKLNNSGTQLLYLVYIGGSGNDSGMGIAVDLSGSAYVTGTTTSADFPTTIGAFSTHSTGSQEAFVVKLGPIGQIEYSTYLGGGSDAGFAIAVDHTGSVYVTGQTESAAFPTTAGTIQPYYEGGLSDCFVSKLAAGGNSLAYSTFFGGSALDLCTGIAIDAASDAYVTGTTYSTNFPIFRAVQSNLKGTASAFVAEINPIGSGLLYSTYLGGSVVDNGNAIAVDEFGSAYVAGSTSSPDFPTTAGAAQTVLAGTYNAFVSELTPGGTGLSYSTLIGGSGNDSAAAISLDTLGQAVIGGFTTSANFPIANAFQPAFQVTRDAFATVVSPGGSNFVFSSYFAGAGDNRGLAIGILPPNNLALAGMTNSANFPTSAPLQSSFGGVYDGFVLSALYQGAQPVGLAFFTVPPCRIADTRAGSGFSGAFGAPFLAGGDTRSFPVLASSCPVPATAEAYSLNLTVAPHGPLAYLSVWPTGQSMPVVSTLNDRAGQPMANAAIVPAGTGGAISLFATNDTDVIIDIDGYFAPPGAPPALAFYPVTPCRVVDTRSSSSGLGEAFGPPQMTAGSTRSFPIPATACNIPPSAEAYSFNITVVPPGILHYLSIWPAGQTMPTVSTLNDSSGAVRANAAIVAAGTNGAVDVFVSDATDVIIDNNGYFAPPGNPGALYFYPLKPCRVADTRAAGGSGLTGLFGPPQMTAGSTRSFPIPSSSCGVPATAQAYSFNFTVAPPGPLNYISTWPTGLAMPLVSTLNDISGAVVANAAIVPAGSNGAISVFALKATDLIIDIDGYFAP